MSTVTATQANMY